MSDSISREKTYKILCEEYPLLQKEHLKSVINKVPSAEPERMKGKWIRITQGAIPEQYICPFCHRTVESYDVEELLPICYPYCHCGADMRG